MDQKGGGVIVFGNLWEGLFVLPSKGGIFEPRAARRKTFFLTFLCDFLTQKRDEIFFGALRAASNMLPFRKIGCVTGLGGKSPDPLHIQFSGSGGGG